MTGPDDWARAAAALEAATGVPYVVTEWAGYEPDGEEWGDPVYAAPADGRDLGHGCADASLPDWQDWLVEQAREAFDGEAVRLARDVLGIEVRVYRF